jgi:hypothetical protein
MAAPYDDAESAKNATLMYVNQPFTDKVIKDVGADSRCYLMAVYTRLSISLPVNYPMLPIEPTTTPAPSRSFLTLDIETLGLMHHKPLPAITCVCLFDGTTRYSYMLYGVSACEYTANCQAILQHLDTAERLAGYNAVLFDLPYIALELKADSQRLESWKAKCVDPYIGLKSVLKSTSKLQKLLEINGLGSKTGCGADAITLAKEGKAAELLEYCMNDVLLTHELCSLDVIKVNNRYGLKLTDEYKWELFDYAPLDPPPSAANRVRRAPEQRITLSEALTQGDCYTSSVELIQQCVSYSAS